MKAYSDISAIIDRSGSMNSMKDEAIGAFNAFLEEQKKVPGEATLSLVLFDHEYLKLYEAKPLQEAEPLTFETYQPRGTTALLDAVGRTIDDTGSRLAALPEAERPEQVIVCILTDGLENASGDYSHERVAKLIKQQRETYSWQFVFLAANQDAFKAGAQLNIDASTTFNFPASKAGTVQAFADMSRSVTKLRKDRNNKT